MDRKEIGNRIKKARKKMGWPQRVLAYNAKCSINSISELELGRKHASILTLMNVCEALGISVSGLLDEKHEPKQTPKTLEPMMIGDGISEEVTRTNIEAWERSINHPVTPISLEERFHVYRFNSDSIKGLTEEVNGMITQGWRVNTNLCTVVMGTKNNGL